MMKEYLNYHKHSHLSNVFTPDSTVQQKAYIDRIIELGDAHPVYFTTEHGYGGDIFEATTLCEEAGIGCKFGAECYIVKDALTKDEKERLDNRNYHIVLVARSDLARKKLNKIMTKANKFGFYYKPRLSVSDLLELDPEDVYLTTACIAGICRDDDGINDIFVPLVRHFEKSMFCEVQAHHDFKQIEHNKVIVELAKKYHLTLIAGTDSHYIYPEQRQQRKDFLDGKDIRYDDEDGFLLDYPCYDDLLERFAKQGVLTRRDAEAALEQTLVFFDCEDIVLNREIKMPTLYPDKTPDEKIEILSKIVNSKFDKICQEENLSDEEIAKRRQGISDEMRVIEETKEINTADYFLFNNKMVELATGKYGGILTRTGRGSGGAEYLNKVLGITQIDRFETKIPLYPERFMSTARLLEARALPDIDFNVAEQEPFIRAQRELLGETGCYPMWALGTMREGEAFRNTCRSMELPYEQYNEVAKNLSAYASSQTWTDVIKKSEEMVGIIVSASIHPCAFLLMSKDIEEEIGIVRIGNELCVPITSSEADEYKYLKNDLLIVTVWKLISETFKEIGQPILSIKELLSKLDESVWDCYKEARTCTLNQIGSDYATSLMTRYKAHSVEEVQKFVAAVRPSFDPWRESFISRAAYSTGVPQLDELLSPTDHYFLFQENLMQFFAWLGIEPAESTSLIKKISKKKIHQEDFDAIEEQLKDEFIKKTGDNNGFDKVWADVQSCMAYGFPAPHAYATAVDSLYGAYLKSHYPLEYYTVCLNAYSDDQVRTARLTKEATYYGIRVEPPKFGKSKDNYSYDREHKTISKGICSVKYMNREIALALYEISNHHAFEDFGELVVYLKNNSSIQVRQLDILIRIGYFSEFGSIPFLLKALDVVQLFKYGDISSINKSSDKFNDFWDEISKNSTDIGKNGNVLKTYSVRNASGLLHDCIEKVRATTTEDWSYAERAKAQNEFLGYVDLTTGKESDRKKLFVMDVFPLVDRKTGKPWAYKITTKSIGSGKVASLNVYASTFSTKPVKKNNILLSTSIGKNNKGYWYLYDYERLE